MGLIDLNTLEQCILIRDNQHHHREHEQIHENWQNLKLKIGLEVILPIYLTDQKVSIYQQNHLECL